MSVFVKFYALLLHCVLLTCQDKSDHLRNTKKEKQFKINSIKMFKHTQIY